MRSRLRLLAAAGAVAALLLAAAYSLLTRVPDGSVLLSGDAVLGPGLRFAPAWRPAALVPVAADLDLRAVAAGPSGEEIEARIRARLGVDPGALRVRGAEVAAAGGFEGFLAAAAAAAIEKGLQDRPAADPLAAGDMALRDAEVAGAWTGDGLRFSEVHVELLDGEGLRALRKTRIRSMARPAGRKVMIVGLDGADWQLVDPLLAEGKLPALGGLLRRGTRADLRSYEPMLSPLLWTTVATGKAPLEHGIIDFLLLDKESGKRVPMSSRFRTVKALWNILTDLGRKSDFVGWWATWPAERVDGTMVTDRVSYSLFAGLGDAPQDAAGLTFPPGYMGEIRDRLVAPEEIGFDEIRRFLRIDRAEYDEGRALLAAPPGSPPEHPVVALARVLAAARSYHAIALDLLRRGQKELTGVYYEGIDQVGHRFMHYAPPRIELASAAEVERYGGAVGAYYRYQDQLLGELLAQAGRDTVFVVLSDHGFKNGSGRPRDVVPYVSEKPGFWHRRYGVFVLAGPGVRQGSIDTVTLYDIAPTVLHLLGLPVPADMEGRVLQEALAGEPEEEPEPMLATYERFGERSQAPATTAAGQAVEAELVRELVALGYVSGTEVGGGGAVEGGGDAEVTGNYHLNRASILAKQEKYAEAEAEVRLALERAEIPDGYRILSELREKQGDLPGAIDAIRRSLESAEEHALAGRSGLKGPGDAGRLRLVGLLLDAARTAEARRVAQGPFDGAAWSLTAQGLVAEKEGRRAEAMRLYQDALNREPTLVAAMIRYFPLVPPAQAGGLESIVRRGLAQNDQLASYHNVLGVILKRRGDLAGAIAEYRRALELEPDSIDYMANLGAAEVARGRPDEAIAILERARRKAPDDPDIWLNLGSAHGKAGRIQQSIAAFERARDLGAPGPGVAVGLALGYLQLGDPARARALVSEARKQYPDDPTLRELESSLP